MTTSKIVVLHRFEELDESAKERARDWYREGLDTDTGCFDFVLDDFDTICGLIGVTLDTRPVKLVGGSIREDPIVLYSGFSSKGDGASFEGRYSYDKGASKAIRAYASIDNELHRITDTLQEVQKRNFYQLSARVSQSGPYCHEMTMTVDVERDSANYQDPTEDAEEVITEALRDLARWLYRSLESEYVYQYSDERVDESIIANEYTFTEDGEVV